MIIRESNPDEFFLLSKLDQYSFDTEDNKYRDKNEYKKFFDKLPYNFKTYVAEDYNTIIAAVGVIKFSQRVRYSWIKMAGISSVLCVPGFRRMGYVQKIFKYIFNKLKKENFIVSSLYPFKFKFYEKLGYGHADDQHAMTFKCCDIIQKKIEDRIVIEDYDPDYKRCQPLYNKFIENYNGMVKRDQKAWKNLFDRHHNMGFYKYICSDKIGNDLGYIILRMEKKTWHNNFKHLKIIEMIFSDLKTKQVLMNFIGNHDSQVEYVEICPFDDNYLLYLKTPRMKSNKIIPNSMFRIINIKKLLPKLKYPGKIDLEITLNIEDNIDQCLWNTGQFNIIIKNGKMEFSESTSKNRVSMKIKALSQIVIGYYSPQELSEAGEVEGSKDSINILSKIFPKTKTALRDYF